MQHFSRPIRPALGYHPHMMALLARVSESGWRPGMNQPSLLAWVIVCGYLLAAAWVWRNGRRGLSASARWWAVTAAILMLLALCKALDLHTGAAETARKAMVQRGLHPQRSDVQAAYAVGVVIVASTFMVLAVTRTPRPRQHIPPLAVTLILAGYMAIRAGSAHAVDEALGIAVGPTRLGTALELAGVVALLSVLLVTWRRTGRNQQACRRHNSSISRA